MRIFKRQYPALLKSLLGLVIVYLVSPWAMALPIESSYSPGQLVVAWVKPGTQVKLDSKVVTVSPQGLLAFGFGRDAKGEQLLELVIGEKTTTHKLKISPRKYKEQHINSLPTNKVKPNPAAQARVAKDNKLIRSARALATPSNWLNGEFIWPVKGRLSGVFGSRRILNGTPKSPHNGIDIAAPSGSKIVAPIAGKVVLVHEDMFYTGKTLMLDHGLGVTSVYAHLSDINVTEGQVLQQGDVLGLVGQTGRATGPHLHFGITWGAVHVDPLLLMPQQATD